ncbi:hypothetical protein LCL61_17625 [Amycolatopsis coloradensis]|uniref:Uncharacterized protein n=1 Tax=Amycolatopsis coloradensis TaxID=76021 RepID=A0ACD5BDK9_9PSEU
MKQFDANFTRISRLLSGTVDPHFARGPKDEWITSVHDQINGVRAGMKMLTMLRPPPEAEPDEGRRKPRPSRP